jgi:hypothetical protein
LALVLQALASQVVELVLVSELESALVSEQVVVHESEELVLDPDLASRALASAVFEPVARVSVAVLEPLDLDWVSQRWALELACSVGKPEVSLPVVVQVLPVSERVGDPRQDFWDLVSPVHESLVARMQVCHWHPQCAEEQRALFHCLLQRSAVPASQDAR